jgi:uncharacterized LabA/DUF88 family protein
MQLLFLLYLHQFLLDYIELIRHLKGEGVRVEVAAVEQTTAPIVKAEADYFIPIDGDDVFVYNKPSKKPFKK